MNFIILGPQGSGKGTQAKLLAQKLGLTHISTGDLLRQEIAKGSEVGKQIKSDLENGRLVSDDILIKVLHQAIKDSTSGIVLDGTPRDIYQAKILEDFLEKQNITIDKVLFIDIPEDESIKRMLKRAEIEHRTDDNLEAIRKRLATYKKLTLPVIDFYRSQNKVVDIDGTPDIDTIHRDICAKLGI